MTEPSRIPYEELPAPLKDRLGARVQRLGYLGEFFQVAAHQPDALAGFIDFTEALKRDLPDRLVEVIALTVASVTGNAYEQVQHERLSLKLGFSETEVRALLAGEMDGFAESEVIVARVAREACEGGGTGCRSYGELAGVVGEECAIGCLMMVSRYLAHATMANTWELTPPVASPLSGGHG